MGSYWGANNLRTDERDSEFPIEARLTQEAGAIAGEMTDLSPIQEYKYRRMLDTPAFKKLLVPVRRACERFADAHPNLWVRTELPPRSTLRGKRTGDAFEFTKSYVGPQTVDTILDGATVHTATIHNHRVQYRGTVAPDGHTLSGAWSIRKRGWKGWFGALDGEGEFRLARQ